MEQKNKKNFLKVLLLSPLPPPSGGIATWTEIVLNWASNSTDLEIYNIDTAVRWRSATYANVLVRIVGGTAQAIFDIFRVVNQVLKNRPNVIHLCTSGSFASLKDLFILIIGKIFGIKTVVHYRMGRLPKIFDSNSLESQMIGFSIKIADVVIVLDDISRNCLKKNFPNSFVVKIPNPIHQASLASFAQDNSRIKLSRDKNHIIYVGWCLPSKGVKDLVEACNNLTGINYQLHIVGNYELSFKEELVELFSHYDINSLIFYGNVVHDNAISLMSQSDMVVLPSYSEGFPNVILEAMALGKPIVATKVGAIPEMLSDDSEKPCGLLLEPGDINGLSQNIEMLFKDRDLCEELGYNSKEKISNHYDINLVMNKYLDIWF